MKNFLVRSKYLILFVILSTLFFIFSNEVLAKSDLKLQSNGPTVLSVIRADENPSSLGAVRFFITFSTDVIDVSIGAFSLATTGDISGVYISGVYGSGSSYTATVFTGSGDGTIRLDVIDNDSIEDINGNFFDSPFNSGEVYTIEKVITDDVAPTVLSVTREDVNPTSSESVAFTVTFSEDVIDVDAADFILTITGDISGAYISNFSGSGTTYDVNVYTGSGNGTIRLDVIDNDTIEDLNENYFESPFNSGEVYTIEKSSATVTADQDPTLDASAQEQTEVPAQNVTEEPSQTQTSEPLESPADDLSQPEIVEEDDGECSGFAGWFDCYIVKPIQRFFCWVRQIFDAGFICE